MVWAFNVSMLCLLLQFNQTGHGSLCSQAIMLVTDGATKMYDDVFERFNWPERKVSFTFWFCFAVSHLFHMMPNSQCEHVFFLFSAVAALFPLPVIDVQCMCQMGRLLWHFEELVLYFITTHNTVMEMSAPVWCFTICWCITEQYLPPLGKKHGKLTSFKGRAYTSISVSMVLVTKSWLVCTFHTSSWSQHWD